MSQQQNYIMWGVAIVVLGGGVWLWQQQEQPAAPARQDTTVAKKIQPVATLNHGHGLAVDITNPDIVYIATHEGLLMLSNDQKLYRIGDAVDDFMGFSAHPTDPNIFFSSGHPAGGGRNLGFQRSDDGGVTWRPVSPGVKGPVDFHALAVSPINPNLMYGWYANALQRSRDQGKTWKIVPTTLSQVTSLVADTTNEKTVYATTTQGIQMSTDEGATWQPRSAEVLGAVTTLAIHPQQPEIMLSFTEQLGVARSHDGGQTWEKMETAMGTDPLMFIAFSKTDPAKVYAYTHGNKLYASKDTGMTWLWLR